MLYSPPPRRLSERAPNLAIRAIRAVLAAVADWRRRRIQRLTLIELMELDSARLDDLGINRFDLIEALRRNDSEAAAWLEQRRDRLAARPPMRR